MSELLLENNEELTLNTYPGHEAEKTAEHIKSIGRVTVLELLAEPTETLTVDMTWQSAWTNKEDK